ncbi:MAG: hypothetical protein IKF52_01450 [Clostridia bacterium]|nr:hypothetical protein [Clostridia bacterium]MBR3152191.1 hypothetical protein [Clostridia bacterium]MBR3152272.1 hypothetical protein [Clostridia bacterium]
MNDDLLNKFSEILKEKNIDPTTLFGNKPDSSTQTTETNTSSNNIFDNIDINTIMKIKTILDSNNTSENNSNLLQALKPYMRESRRNKIDQYSQILRYIKIFKTLQKQGGDK